MAYYDLINQLAIGYDIACPINAQSINPWDDEMPTREVPDYQRLIAAAMAAASDGARD